MVLQIGEIVMVIEIVLCKAMVYSTLVCDGVFDCVGK